MHDRVTDRRAAQAATGERSAAAVEADEARRIVRRGLRGYALGSLGALLLVGGGAVYVAGQVAEAAAIRDAGQYTRQLAELSVAHYVTPALRAGDAAAIAALDDAVRVQVQANQVLRVKVWSPDSTILYSDERRLIGRVYPLEEDDLEVLREGGLDAHVSPSTKSENEFESGFGPTLEVYAAIRAPDGSAALVETYLPIERLETLRQQLVQQIAPFVVLPLLLLELLLVPLAVRLAQRVARVHTERAVLSRLAASAAEAERRAVAAQLHDTVVQDLAGVGFALSTVGEAARRSGGDDVHAAISRVRDIVVEDVATLRGIMGALAADDDPSTRTLADVVEAATDPARAAGLTLDVQIDGAAAVAPDAHTAVALVVREAVRNAVRHAGATRLTVTLAVDGDDVVLTVADDGRGFDPSQVRSLGQGHLGLTLYQQAARVCGGTAHLVSTPGEGTRLTLTVPAAGRRAPRYRRLRRRRA